MKKIKKFFPFIVISILISLAFILFFSFSKHNKKIYNVTSIKVVSSVKEQIQNKEDFRLDKIVIDIQMGNGHQNKIVTKEMLSDEDKAKLDVVGLHKITLKYLDFSIKLYLMIYDDSYLKENYIYFYKEEESTTIMTAKNVLELEVPYKEGYYFYGWYDSEIQNEIYEDKEEKIVQLYPRWSKEKVHKIDFYVGEEVIERKYVIDNEIISYPNVLEDGFYCWDNNVSITQKDLDIFSIFLEENQTCVRFYNKFRELIEYRVISIGESITDYPKPELEGFSFYKWTQNLENITTSMDCFPIYYEPSTTFTVNFYDMDGNFLESKIVPYGHNVSYELQDDKYYVSGYSKNIDEITCDMDVTVYFYPNIYYYYDEDKLYAARLSTQIPPETPMKSGYTGYWIKEEGSKTNFFVQYRKNGECFHFITVDDNKEYIFQYTEFHPKLINYLLAIKTGKYNAYIWYDNETCTHLFDNIYQAITEPGDSFNSNYFSTPDVYAYGKTEKDSTVGKYYISGYRTTLYEDGVMLSNYNFLNDRIIYPDYPNKKIVEISNLYCNYELDYKPIIAVEFKDLLNFEYVLLGEKICHLEGLNADLPSSIKCFFVAENNPYFYSENGNLYDKTTNELLYEVNK